MINLSDKFISLGINYKPELFRDVRNKKFFQNINFSPSKPEYGGLWASPLNITEAYVSNWHRFLKTKLSPDLFEEKLNSKATVFKLTEQTNLIYIDSASDIVLDLETKPKLPSLPTCPIKVTKTLKEYSNFRFIDFERLSKLYDALFISQKAIDELQNALQMYDESVYYGNNIPFDPELVYKAHLFEDWHVETLLVLNNECIEIVCHDYIGNLSEI